MKKNKKYNFNFEKKRKKSIDGWKLFKIIGICLVVLLIIFLILIEKTSCISNLILRTRDYEENNICYQINKEDNTAFVKESLNASGEIIIPSSVTYNDEKYKVTKVLRDAFKNNTEVYKVKISEGIKEIESGAFYNNYILEVSLPNSIEFCDGYSFGSNVKCEILEGFKYLGNTDNPYVFLFDYDYTINKLNMIELPEGLKCISNREGLLNNIKDIIIPDTVLYFDSRSLITTPMYSKDEPYGSVENLYISENTQLKTFDMYSLNYCKKLTNLYIPKTITELPNNLSKGLNSLQKVDVHPENPNYKSDNSNSIIEKKSNILLVGSANAKIPNYVTTIGDCAFYCKSMSKIDIPTSVTTIGEYAFYGCSNLTELIFPKSINVIGFGAIKGCSSLTKLVLPFVGRSVSEESELNSSISYILGEESVGLYSDVASLPNAKIYIDAKSPIILKEYSLVVKAKEIYLLSNIAEVQKNVIHWSVSSIYISKDVKKISGGIFYNYKPYDYNNYKVMTNAYCESEEIIPGWITTWFDSDGEIIWCTDFEAIRAEIE